MKIRKKGKRKGRIEEGIHKHYDIVVAALQFLRNENIC